MKIYPRLELDITMPDLGSSLLSAFVATDRDQTISQILSLWPTPQETLVTLCVRISLDLLLQVLRLPAGSEILMSAVNIVHMTEIIRHHNWVVP